MLFLLQFINNSKKRKKLNIIILHRLNDQNTLYKYLFKKIKSIKYIIYGNVIPTVGQSALRSRYISCGTILYINLSFFIIR